MTKYFRFLACLTALVLSAGLLKAQAPYKFAYQAIVRSEANQIVRNTQVDVRIAILKNAENGAQVYKEKQSPKTDENGLYTIVVGGPDATSVTGTIKDIEWGNGVYFIKAEVDVDKDGTYDLTTIQQLVSVPYVFHANVTDEGLKEILANGNSGDASHNKQIKCLANPTDNNDVVNKAYLDSILAYIDENYGGCKLAEVKLSDITATENGCGTKLKVKTETLSGTVSYQWYRDNSPISGATSASYDATAAGTYKVVATATCEDGTPATATDTKSKSVEASGPTLTLGDIKYSGAKSGSGTSVTVAQNATLTLSAEATSNGELSYQWSGGSSSTLASITASTSSLTTTKYTVTVTAEDDNGCTAQETKEISVTVESSCPTPVVSASNLKLSTCPMYKSKTSTVTLSVTASASGCEAGCTYTYVWTGTVTECKTTLSMYDNPSAITNSSGSGISSQQTTTSSSSACIIPSTGISSNAGQKYWYHCNIQAVNSCGNTSAWKHVNTNCTLYN